MSPMRRPRALATDERDRLIGLAIGYFLGMLSLGAVSFATSLGSARRGLDPDHWMLWLIRVLVLLVVVSASAATVFITRLWSRGDQEARRPRSRG